MDVLKHHIKVSSEDESKVFVPIMVGDSSNLIGHAMRTHIANKQVPICVFDATHVACQGGATIHTDPKRSHESIPDLLNLVKDRGRMDDLHILNYMVKK